MPKRSRREDDEEPAWSVPSLREPRYSQSLERGLAILVCFSGEHPVRGIADLADELGMSRSTTHRYVITLVALGYLEQGASRKYRLGGDTARRAFAEAACPCRAHPNRKPPTGASVAAHAAVVRCLQAHEALDGEVPDRREWLLATAAMASHVAHDAGVDSTLPIVFEELFAGLDRDDELRREAG